jgi:hypothetical protein
MLSEAEIWGIYLGFAGIIIGLVAIFFAIFIPLGVERLRRPHLIVRLSANPIPTQSSRFLHCRVINHPHDRLTWIDRNPAYDTSVRLTFRMNGQNGQIIRGPVMTKWTIAPECITPILQIVNNELPQNPELVNTIEVFDSTKTIFAHNLTLPSDNMGQEFDVVVKNDGDNECYAVTGWSYRFPGFRDPELTIPIGHFTVEIQVIASNSRSKVTRFRLRNTGHNLNDIELTEI